MAIRYVPAHSSQRTRPATTFGSMILLASPLWRFITVIHHIFICKRNSIHNFLRPRAAFSAYIINPSNPLISTDALGTVGSEHWIMQIARWCLNDRALCVWLGFIGCIKWVFLLWYECVDVDAEKQNCARRSRLVRIKIVTCNCCYIRICGSHTFRPQVEVLITLIYYTNIIYICCCSYLDIYIYACGCGGIRVLCLLCVVAMWQSGPRARPAGHSLFISSRVVFFNEFYNKTYYKLIRIDFIELD